MVWHILRSLARRIPAGLIIFWLLIIPLLVGRCYASDLSPQAMAATKRGLAAAKAENWERAIKHFQEALHKSGEQYKYQPSLLFNLALAYDRSGRSPMAASLLFRSFLAAFPNSSNAWFVKKRIVELDRTTLSLAKQIRKMAISRINLFYARQKMKFKKRGKRYSYSCSFYTDIIDLYMYFEEYDRALALAQRLPKYDGYGNKCMPNYYSTISFAYLRMGNIKKAKEYYEKIDKTHFLYQANKWMFKQDIERVAHRNKRLQNIINTKYKRDKECSWWYEYFVNLKHKNLHEYLNQAENRIRVKDYTGHYDVAKDIVLHLYNIKKQSRYWEKARTMAAGR